MAISGMLDHNVDNCTSAYSAEMPHGRPHKAIDYVRKRWGSGPVGLVRGPEALILEP